MTVTRITFASGRSAVVAAPSVEFSVDGMHVERGAPLRAFRSVTMRSPDGRLIGELGPDEMDLAAPRIKAGEDAEKVLCDLMA